LPVLAKTNLGNLQGIVNQLQQGGLGPQVQSWLGSGANLPVTPDQIRTALGNEHVRLLAQHLGVDPDAALTKAVGRPPSERRRSGEPERNVATFVTALAYNGPASLERCQRLCHHF
jgi:hypothetical protein